MDQKNIATILIRLADNAKIFLEQNDITDAQIDRVRALLIVAKIGFDEYYLYYERSMSDERREDPQRYDLSPRIFTDVIILLIRKANKLDWFNPGHSFSLLTQAKGLLRDILSRQRLDSTRLKNTVRTAITGTDGFPAYTFREAQTQNVMQNITLLVR